jgi:hypothetical protein
MDDVFPRMNDLQLCLMKLKNLEPEPELEIYSDFFDCCSHSSSERNWEISCPYNDRDPFYEIYHDCCSECDSECKIHNNDYDISGNDSDDNDDDDSEMQLNNN